MTFPTKIAHCYHSELRLHKGDTRRKLRPNFDFLTL